MRCEVCAGRGYIQASHNDRPTPCPECNCYGVISCCDGLREQPDNDNSLGALTNDRTP